MPGIVIPVDTETRNAQQELRQLNKHLAQIVRNANVTSKALGNINTRDIFKQQNVKPFENSIKNTNSSLFSLKSTIIAVGTALAALTTINVFNKMSDSLTNLQNRLKLVTTSFNNLLVTQRQLYNISQDTRTSFADVGNIFVDFSKALELRKVNPDRLKGIITTFQQMAVLSGSSPEALKGALTQFTQGLASGTLRGEELNSVMEQMKYFSFGLQDALKMNAGSLRKFAEEGACVVISDINQERLETTEMEFRAAFGRDTAATTQMDVTNTASIQKAMAEVCLAFGGVDIVVNNAGISISKSIKDHTIEEWDRLYDILVKGQFIVSQAAVEVMRKQDIGGDIINIVSKNAVVAGPNNPGYGSAKAAQAHLTRLMAAELGADKIRVNTVNPDAVIADSNIWAGGWAEGRAKAYGIKVEELPAYYAKRTLLNEIILPDDIANACFAFVGGLLNKSTGNALNVDGGVSMGFYR